MKNAECACIKFKILSIHNGNKAFKKFAYFSLRKTFPLQLFWLVANIIFIFAFCFEYGILTRKLLLEFRIYDSIIISGVPL
jgi:hypothetical protein